jgi:hypothetical protein
VEMEQVLADKAPARAGEWAVAFPSAKASAAWGPALVVDEDKGGEKAWAWAAAKVKEVVVAAACAVGSPLTSHGNAVSGRRDDNAWRRWNGTDGHGIDDGTRSRFLCRLWRAGLHEPWPCSVGRRMACRSRIRGRCFQPLLRYGRWCASVGVWHGRPLRLGVWTRSWVRARLGPWLGTYAIRLCLVK